MTPAKRIEKAFDDAHVVITEYLQPGPRNAEATVGQLIKILDRKELHDALVGLLRNEREEPTLVPTVAATFEEFQKS
jgi:hypothetical protein